MKENEMHPYNMADYEPVTVMLEVDPDGRVLFDIDRVYLSDAGEDTYILMCLFGKLIEKAPYKNSQGFTFDFASASALHR